MGLIGFFITTFILFVFAFAIFDDFMKEVEPEPADERFAIPEIGGLQNGEHVSTSGVGVGNAATEREETELTNLLEEMQREEEDFQRLMEEQQVEMLLEEKAVFDSQQSVVDEEENLARFTDETILHGNMDDDNLPPNPYVQPGIDLVTDMDYHHTVDNPLDMLEDDLDSYNTLDTDSHWDNHYGGDDY